MKKNIFPSSSLIVAIIFSIFVSNGLIAKKRIMADRFHEETKRREDQRAKRTKITKYSPEVRDFLNKQSVKMNISYNTLLKFITKASNNPRDLFSLKELLKTISETTTDMDSVVTISKLTSKMIHFKNRDMKLPFDIKTVERASKEWTVEELKEFESLAQEVWEKTLLTGIDGNKIKEALEETFGKEDADALTLSCK